MIRALHWAADGPPEAVPVEKLAAAASLPGGEYYWLDLCAPTPADEERVLAELVPVHPVTREDAAGPCRGGGPDLSKIEAFADYLFVATNPAPADLFADAPAPPRRAPREQLAAVVTRTALVTLHARPLPCIDRAWGRAKLHADRGGPDWLLHLVLDALVDDYAPLFDAIDERLDDLEASLLRARHGRAIPRLLALKRKTALLNRSLATGHEVVARLARGEFSVIDARERAYYRDAAEHLAHYAGLAEQAQEAVSDLMHLHLAASSNRLNEVMKVLTMTSTVILPMTLIAGVYGMNFDRLPGQHDAGGFYYALAAMVGCAAAALGYFSWRGWVKLPLAKRRRRP